MTALDAAFQVLRDAGQPLHAEEIFRRITAQNLWENQGKTPGATIMAALYMDIKRRGPGSRFVKAGKKTFALNQSVSQDKSGETAPASENISDKPLSFTNAAE